MDLQELIARVEHNVGLFSAHYKTIGNGHSYDIPFEIKPAQQVIFALGGGSQKTLQLTSKGTIKPTGSPDVKINSFKPKAAQSELTMSGSCLDRLFQSSKIYLDSSVTPSHLYQSLLKKIPEKVKRIHLEHMAIGVCHAQEIVLLVDTLISQHGRAHTTVRENGTFIDEKSPSLLLLSSSPLNLRGKDVTKQEQVKLIRSMYRNLFDTTLREGRNYIALPAAGIGKHGGKPGMYFAILMSVATEFPDLNVIYHAGSHEKQFDVVLKKSGLKNMVRTTKNILFIADKLTKEGHLCAVHNPSGMDVIYGLTDVGGHWKSTSTIGALLGDESKTFQAYIGAVSTAPLNSFGINPEAYQRVIARDLSLVAAQTENLKSNEKPVTEPPRTMPPSSSTSTLNSNNSLFTPLKTAPEIIIKKEKIALLSDAQLSEITLTINRLRKEIKSSWPYPNKDVKQIKVNALNELINKAQMMDNLSDVVADIKKKYPRVAEGRFSTRTADLLNKLHRESEIDTLMHHGFV